MDIADRVADRVKDAYDTVRHIRVNDVLRPVGLQRRRKAYARYRIPEAALFALGCILGAAAALLVTPKPGRDVVHALRRGFNRMGTWLVASLPVKARRARGELAEEMREELGQRPVVPPAPTTH